MGNLKQSYSFKQYYCKSYNLTQESRHVLEERFVSSVNGTLGAQQ